MINRRTVLLSTAATALASPRVRAQSAAKRVRSDVATADGKKMLAIYAQGVKAMKALAATNPTSWTFQWYTHAIPTGTTAAMIQKVFGNTNSPAKTLAQAAWYTCQPHQQGEPTDYFVPWHRLYVIYLEQIIQTITGHAEFALPYWNYTSPDSYAIPAEFQTASKGDPVFGTLFQANRNVDNKKQQYADVNGGEPINKYFAGQENPLNLASLGFSDFSTFNSNLNDNLHGMVHVLTGNGKNMGYVPTAAEDPVFWLHHCNIDRIWYSWNALGYKNPTATNGKLWSDTMFTFANGAGTQVSASLGSISDSASLSYVYDSLLKPPASVVASTSKPESPALLRSAGTGAVAGSSASVSLGGTPMAVKLTPTAPQNRLMAVAPALRSTGHGPLILRLKNVGAAANPDVIYRVYLDLPANALPDVAAQHFVGLLNFFAFVHGAGHDMQMAPPRDEAAEFDVTDLVARLSAQNALATDTVVTLVPAGSPAAGSLPVIAGGIEMKQR